MTLSQAQKDVSDARLKGLADYPAYDIARDAYDAEVAANGITPTARTHQVARNAAAHLMADELGI